jgi:hypothetical protein
MFRKNEQQQSDNNEGNNSLERPHFHKIFPCKSVLFIYSVCDCCKQLFEIITPQNKFVGVRYFINTNY